MRGWVFVEQHIRDFAEVMLVPTQEQLFKKKEVDWIRYVVLFFKIIGWGIWLSFSSTPVYLSCLLRKPSSGKELKPEKKHTTNPSKDGKTYQKSRQRYARLFGTMFPSFKYSQLGWTTPVKSGLTYTFDTRRLSHSWTWYHYQTRSSTQYCAPSATKWIMRWVRTRKPPKLF